MPIEGFERLSPHRPIKNLQASADPHRLTERSRTICTGSGSAVAKWRCNAHGFRVTPAGNATQGCAAFAKKTTCDRRHLTRITTRCRLLWSATCAETHLAVAVKTYQTGFDRAAPGWNETQATRIGNSRSHRTPRDLDVAETQDAQCVVGMMNHTDPTATGCIVKMFE